MKYINKKIQTYTRSARLGCKSNYKQRLQAKQQNREQQSKTKNIAKHAQKNKK
jgi:hypothetical protein